MDKLYGDLKFNENRNIKRSNQKSELKRLKREAQDNFETLKWNEQWEKAKQLKERTDSHEIFLNKIKDNREYQTLEMQSERREAERVREEEMNNMLKMQYKQLLEDKEILKKALGLYK